MMNKKLIALFVAIATAGTITTRCLADGIFGNLGRAAGGLVKDTGELVKDTGEAAAKVPARLATGESVDELEEDNRIRQGKPTRQTVREQTPEGESYTREKYYRE
jgi:hypothetical protein